MQHILHVWIPHCPRHGILHEQVQKSCGQFVTESNANTSLPIYSELLHFYHQRRKCVPVFFPVKGGREGEGHYLLCVPQFVTRLLPEWEKSGDVAIGM